MTNILAKDKLKEDEARLQSPPSPLWAAKARRRRKYGDRKAHDIIFGAEARLTDKDTILFKLKNDIENRDIGINLELSRKIIKGDGEAFIRALKSKRETAVYAGSAWRW